MSRLSGTIFLLYGVVGALFLHGCGGNEGHEIIIEFPQPAQEYKNVTKKLKIFLLVPTVETATCQDLTSGVHNPEDDLYSIKGSEEITTPFTKKIDTLKVSKKETGPRLFFVQGKNSKGEVILRGCVEVKPGDTTQSITMSLELACPQGTACTNVCGNEVVEAGETCDSGIAAGQPGACPTSCVDSDGCTIDTMTGSVANCTAACPHDRIIQCANNDGCCPDGCTTANDNDCTCACGNGVVESACSENCDTAIAAGQTGACPTSCTAPDTCHTSTLTGTACQTTCTVAVIPNCCGNGIVEAGETCDTAIMSGAGKCPTLADCNDSIVCTTDTLAGSACTTHCVNTPITPCCGNGTVETGEACDPPNGTTCDTSCKFIMCGNGIVDVGEECDIAITPPQTGSCPTSCDDGNTCTIDILTGSAALCTARCTRAQITTCSMISDGCCPAGCNAMMDPDCP